MLNNYDNLSMPHSYLSDGMQICGRKYKYHEDSLIFGKELADYLVIKTKCRCYIEAFFNSISLITNDDTTNFYSKLIIKDFLIDSAIKKKLMLVLPNIIKKKEECLCHSEFEIDDSSEDDIVEVREKTDEEVILDELRVGCDYILDNRMNVYLCDDIPETYNNDYIINVAFGENIRRCEGIYFYKPDIPYLISNDLKFLYFTKKKKYVRGCFHYRLRNYWYVVSNEISLNFRIAKSVDDSPSFVDHLNPKDVYHTRGSTQVAYIDAYKQLGFDIAEYNENTDKKPNVGFACDRYVTDTGMYYISLMNGHKYYTKKVDYNSNYSIMCVPEGALIYNFPEINNNSILDTCNNRVYIAYESKEFLLTDGDSKRMLLILVFNSVYDGDNRKLFRDGAFDKLAHCVSGPEGFHLLTVNAERLKGNKLRKDLGGAYGYVNYIVSGKKKKRNRNNRPAHVKSHHPRGRIGKNRARKKKNRRWK
jgi:hypothetical protein